MKGIATIKRIVAVWVTFCMIVSSLGLMTVTALADPLTDGKLLISGFDFYYQNDNSIQAVLDVSLQDIDATGVGFILEYDPDYLVPSYFEADGTHDANEEITDYRDIMKSFSQNIAVFDKGTNPDSSTYDYLVSSLSTKIGTELSYILSISDKAPTGTYVGEQEFRVGTTTIKRKCIKAKDDTVSLGKISFRVTNSLQLFNLTADNLQNVLKLVSYDGESEARVIYIDETDNNIEKFIGPLPVELKAIRTLDSVVPAVDHRTLSAYSLYNRCEGSGKGTIDDLFAYLNQTMGNVILRYTDGSNEMNRMTWSASNAAVVIDGTSDTTYHPKGGVTYKITQYYGEYRDPSTLTDEEKAEQEKRKVEAWVTVTEATLTGFNYPRKTLTLYTLPSAWDDLDMPDVVTPIVTGVDDTYIPPTESPIDAAANWTPNDLPDVVNTSRTYTHTVSNTIFSADELIWLTIPAGFDWDITAKRNYSTDPEPQPTDPSGNPYVTAKVDRRTGALIIDVPKEAFNPSGIDSGYDFTIYLPNGEVISTTADYVTVTPHSPSDGGVTITVYPMDPSSAAFTDGSDAANDLVLKQRQREIQSLINLGNSDFTISATPAGGVESSAIGFAFDARQNYYLPDSNTPDSKNRLYVEKDYSGGRAGLFPVYEGQDPAADIATYLNFPDSSTISTAYHGQTGYQKSDDLDGGVDVSVIESAKVISWSWEQLDGTTGTGNLPAKDTTFYLVGKLQDYSYTNFGFVWNVEDGHPASTTSEEVYLKLKVTTLADPSTLPSPSPGASGTPDPSASPSASPDPSASPAASPDPSASPAATTEPKPKYGLKVTTQLSAAAGGATVEVASTESGVITTFQYDTKNPGYNPVQDQEYTLENIGTDDISGLSVRISDFEYTPPDSTTAQPYTDVSFIMGNNNVYKDPPLVPNITSLNAGGSAKMKIRTKYSLPEGTYTARVSVGSSLSTELTYFYISFKVTEKTLYNVSVNNDEGYRIGALINPGVSPPPAMALAYLMDTSDPSNHTIYSSTYAENDDVPLHVDLLDDGYILKEWYVTETQDPPSADPLLDAEETVTFTPGKNDESTKFQMIAKHLTVTPVYEETPNLWIRLADLRDYNGAFATPQPVPNQLRDPDPPYNATTYRETQFGYRTIVEGNVDQNYVEFDLKLVQRLKDENPNHDGTTVPPVSVTITLDQEKPDGTLERTISSMTYTDTTEQGSNANTRKYRTQDLDLRSGENIVTITTTYVENAGTADEKTYTKSYKLTIFRKKSVDVKMNFGNSPYGLIRQADNLTAAEKGDDTTKGTAMTAFDVNHMYDPAMTPDKAVITKDTRYTTEAWTWTDSSDVTHTENYDENPYALFVYNGEKFVDPGFYDLKKVSGDPVDPRDVTRKIKEPFVVTSTNITQMTDLTGLTVSGDITVYDPSATYASPVVDANGQCLFDMSEAGRKLRPGVYEIEYSFTDSDNSTATFTRPLIVLPKKGDINISNALEDTDADMLYQRMNNTNNAASPGFFTEMINGDELWKVLYAFRVGDVTEDRNVNSVDANAVLNRSSVSITTRQYYEPLPTGLADVMPTFTPSGSPRPTAEPVPTSTPKPVLKLDYLEMGTPAEVPQVPNLTESSVYDAANFLDPGGIVWLGVGITNVPNLEYFLDGLYSIDIAIDYDPEIFAPVDHNWHQPASSTDATFKAQLINTLNRFNMSGVSNALCKWENAAIYPDSLQWDLDIDSTDDYKTEFVTIKSTDGTNLRLTQTPQPAMTDTVYLLRIPLLLIKYPDENYTGEAVTLNLTENTFVMGATADGVTHSASWEGVTDKTTAVNNAKNHFDLDIVDLFNTNGTYDVTGIMRGWDPSEPFTVEFYKSPEDAAAEVSFSSLDLDPTQTSYLYGGYTASAKGEVEWAFKLPVPNRFDYVMRVYKLSHIDYQYEEWIDRANVTSGAFNITNPIELTVGDMNRDGYIKDPDRVQIIRFFNRQKPWNLYTDLFEAADLNGDGAVNLFDINIQKQSIAKLETGGGG